MQEYLKVVLISFLSYVLLFISAKILGKKQIAELDFTDYVIGISIGSIAAEWAIDPETPWYSFVIAIIVYTILSLTVDCLERKSLIFKRILKGKPIIIIEHGKINYKNLKKSKLSINDIIGMCRCKNYFNINELEYVIFENNGDVSILPKSDHLPLESKDLKLKKEKSELTKYLITDGVINKNYLKMINKDVKWLLKVLNLKSENEIKNIILASYDLNSKEKFIHYK